MSDDPNALQKAVAARGDAFQRERDIRNRADCTKKALQGLGENDRKRVLDLALNELGSRLAIRVDC